MTSTESHPSTEAVVAAVREVAAEYGRAVTAVTHDIGADQVARRTSAPLFAVADPDGSLPHEAFVELSGPPRIELTVHPEGDTRVVVEGVDFPDVAHEHVPDFLRALFLGTAHLKSRFFPPATTLVVPLPGDVTYKEHVGAPLSPWLAARRR
ncbi:hypothetical protein J7W19_01395 [Streptomyces mobaraensis NBRC 13819 = DSM 40847]|uniref:Uncharacterized protein n=1 Tax=Streptomyces mobaraensis (strain ATCC 29032 / DSM 40847 / JCM 4168 / NBRC 13819 / NCIMB 11159 / IPCR 16-22) TaxID=1223523 RepID=M3CAX7_STRM1|nr:hypothetical protein [Streptomyces mobaraensis]EMF01126.1 hypothetical protein H340_07478 [Streptomyces mobaraensis NBRC 13819 = DSM 40847]QTT72260.1 hypothetical protein J7W19_01395 [Streptomyces mobaraensis NBRC 13819 = DSM 40847]